MKMLNQRLPELEAKVRTLKPDPKELAKMEQAVKDAEVDLGAAVAQAASAKVSFRICFHNRVLAIHFLTVSIYFGSLLLIF